MTTCLGPAFVNMRAANAKRSKVKPEAGLPVCWTEAVGSLAEINGGISSRECLPGRGFALFSTAAVQHRRHFAGSVYGDSPQSRQFPNLFHFLDLCKGALRNRDGEGPGH